MLTFNISTILLVVMCFVGRMIKSLQKRYQDKLALASSTAEESISNVRTVRFFSNENRMVSSYEKDINQSYFLGRKLAAVMGTYVVIIVCVYVHVKIRGCHVVLCIRIMEV